MSPGVSIEQLQALPLCLRATIPEEFRDPMGHMNVRYYMALFDDASWRFFARLGMTLDYIEQENAGGFALEHHLRYLAEVYVGETVAVYGRLLGLSAKRVHFMLFMVNETRRLLASTYEELSAHADMNIRKTSPFPARIALQIGALLEEHDKLEWEAPVCGVLRP
jgi:acyl-CoA thioester hydrolase